MLFLQNRISIKLKTMEFTATAIKTFQYTSYGPLPVGEISFKSDCTEYKHGLSNGHVANIQTYCRQDASKEKNLVFPTKFIKFFKLLGTSESGRKFWFDEHKRTNFDEAGIDTNYDAEFGDICSGDSKSDLMRYIYRDMVVPFTKLEKENHDLRNQLEQMKKQHESKDQQHKSEKLKVYYDCVCEFQEELEEKDQQLNTTQEELEEKDQEIEEMKKQLKEKDQELKTTQQELKTTQQELKTTQQELKTTQQELKTTQQELKIKHDKYLSELLKVSTLKFALEAKDEEIEEELEEKNQEIQLLKEQLKIKYHDYLIEVQEEFEEKDQEIEKKDQELKTRGLLLKTCIEKVEDVEKKNQELEHLNHRLIYETSFNERKSSSYFGPEM